MEKLCSLANKAQSLLNTTRAVDFLGPLALRLYLVPVFWMPAAKSLAISKARLPGLATLTGDLACPSLN